MSQVLDPKDPASIKPYYVDWSDYLEKEQDIIATSSWSASSPSGLTQSGATFIGSVTMVFIAGGSDSTDYALRNTITTRGGRTDVRVVTVRVRTAV